MPFIPHTEQDVQEMLQAIGVSSIEQLFDEIPEALRHAPLDNIPVGLSEMELSRLAQERAQQDGNLLCFIGAGAYEHYIPAAVWEIATRGEFYTAYTPYQAEASQGSLQLIYEYQTMMANLMAMEVSNASLYDGASALAEAILMAVRLSEKKLADKKTDKKHHASILMPRNVHPHYRATVHTIVRQQNIHLIDVPYNPDTGRIEIEKLPSLLTENTVALAIPQPNFFGTLEDVDALTHWAKKYNLLTIAVVNPMAMALLKPPGQWDQTGVDIVCGEGQPLGIPLASGGPYYGFLCCKKIHVRQMPGRIVGATVDADGKPGYVLTLQAREQHIRRAKATSNICTNQGLMVTASTIFMSLLGPHGLRHIAALCHQHTRAMEKILVNIPGVSAIFKTPYFHEIVVRINQPVPQVLAALAKQGIQGGYALGQSYPELSDCLLLCATETKNQQDIQHLATALNTILTGEMVNGSKQTCQV